MPAAAKLTRDSSVFMDDSRSVGARFRAQIRWKLVVVAPQPVLLLLLLSCLKPRVFWPVEGQRLVNVPSIKGPPPPRQRRIRRKTQLIQLLNNTSNRANLPRSGRLVQSRIGVNCCLNISVWLQTIGGRVGWSIFIASRRCRAGAQPAP